jgi:hypothetical protein
MLTRNTLLAVSGAAMIVAASATVEAGGLFGDGGLIRGTIGKWGDKHVDRNWKKLGKHVEKGFDVRQGTSDIFYAVASDEIEKNLGSDWERAYRNLTSQERIQSELENTAGRYLGKCMQGKPCNLETLVSGPVAASLRDAYKYYSRYAEPLRAREIEILSRAVPVNTLREARIAIGRLPDLSLPGFLNSANQATADGYAVTIADLIVFSQDINLNNDTELLWLLHELQHSRQYAKYGSNWGEAIDGFAGAYVKDYSKFERDADKTAETWFKKITGYGY